MPVLDIIPGTTAPETPGTLQFYEQGADPSTGFQVTTRGAIISAVSQAYTGAAATSVALSTQVSGDSANRYQLRADGRIDWGPGNGAVDTDLYRQGAGVLQTDSYFVAGGGGQANASFTVAGGSLVLSPVGVGVQAKEGTNAIMGLATLSAGAVTVSTTKVTANSRIFLTAQSSGAAPGALRVSGRTAGTSFTITSTSGTDTSTVAWLIVEPAP